MGFFQALKNWFRGVSNDAAEQLSDPIRDAGFAIEDAKKEYADFEAQVVNLVAQNKQNETEAKNARAQEAKYSNFAVLAAKSGNRQDVEDAIKEKNKFSTKASRLESEVTANNQTIEKLKDSLAKIREKIDHAETNKDVYAARMKGAQTREKVMNKMDSINGGTGLAALDELEKKTIEAEAHADATAEVTGADKETLEDKYASGNVEIQSEVDKLMAEHSAK